MKESGHKVFRETNTCEEQAAVILQDLKEGRLSGKNKKTEHEVAQVEEERIRRKS